MSDCDWLVSYDRRKDVNYLVREATQDQHPEVYNRNPKKYTDYSFSGPNFWFVIIMAFIVLVLPLIILAVVLGG